MVFRAEGGRVIRRDLGAFDSGVWRLCKSGLEVKLDVRSNDFLFGYGGFDSLSDLLSSDSDRTSARRP